MDRIIDGRGTGKTSRLMQMAKDNNATIACANPRAMEQKAHAYGIVGLNFCSYTDLLDQKLKGQHKPIYIDEVDNLLKIIDSYINGYTLTNED